MKFNTLTPKTTQVGDILRFWRHQKRISQMDLAMDIGISTRHLSFLENGKSQPSKEMVLYLGQALQLPYRQQNSLLLAAGFAPQFKEQNLDSDELQVVHQALQQLLKNHDPLPALVINSRYDILMHNTGYESFIAALLGEHVLSEYSNALELFFAEDGLKPLIKNWQVAAPMLYTRVCEEAFSTQDPWLLDWVNSVDFDMPAEGLGQVMNYGLPMFTLEISINGQRGRFFTTIATIGTPLDLTTQEIRLEMLYPADAATQRLFKST